MALVTLRNACISIGNALLLDHINLNIEPRERVTLIGRNGAGKSTLMKVINNEVPLDEGESIYQTGIHVARLEQEVPRAMTGSIFSVIAAGLGAAGITLADYLSQIEKDNTSLSQTQNKSLDIQIDWSLQGRIEKVLSELSLSGTDDFATLSGGMKRRVLLGRALVQEPDLLLLDEPTNHLDIESILWLEKFLSNYPAALLFITHDRALLQNLATRIIELDRGILTSFPGDYATYQTRKAAMLETEAKHNALFDKKLAQEEVWIRQGIKARRTRNEGRVRALKKLREERSSRRDRIGQVSLAVSMAERSSHLIIEAQDISYQFHDNLLINKFSTNIIRGDKIGIIGPNGCGKSTLLQILLEKLKPNTGTVRLGQNLQIAYFDQLREQLDRNQSVADNVMEGSTTIEINGQKKHIISYLQDFLFTPDRARGPVKVLSGGERNRLLLAKLFAKPSNVLVMDEPTNDLDTETLDLLEELLIDYQGTLIIVSHDRAFLNNVVTSIIAFEGAGHVFEYVGGYDDWQRQRRTSAPALPAKAKAEATTNTSVKPKLSYSQQYQLKKIEDRITMIETEQTQLKIEIAGPQFYELSVTEQQKVFAQMQTLEQELESLLQQWDLLENRR